METKIILSLLSLCFLSNCNYRMDKSSETRTGAPSSPSESQATPLGFQQVFEQVLKPRCIECHSNSRAAAGVNIEDYQNVFNNQEDIRSAISTSRMPLSRPPLTAVERDLLFRWLDQGAPKEGKVVTQPAPSPAPEPTPTPIPVPTPPPPSQPELPSSVTYANVNEQVLGPRCTKCHSEAGGNRGGLNLETFESVQAALQVIAEEVSADQMPPRKPLSPEEKAILLAWIQNGAPK